MPACTSFQLDKQIARTPCGQPIAPGNNLSAHEKKKECFLGGTPSFFRRGKQMRKLFVAIVVVTILSAAVSADPFYREQGRLMPPAQLKCDRNDVTVYDGRVIVYRRRKGSTFLRMRTNFDTTEDVTLRHPRTTDSSKFYLISGTAFTSSDWSRIEKRPYVLRPGMRANVWVCRGNPAIQPVVDWQPEDTGANPRSR